MRNISIIMLIVAVILGGLSVIGVRALLLNSSQQAAQVQVAETVVSSTIVVAGSFLEFGAEITDEMLREIPWATEDRPEGSFESISDILTGERRVVLRAIAPGQLVLTEQISRSGERAALSQFLGEGMRAVSIRVNEVSGAAGFILPGNHVDVLLTMDADNDPRQAATNVILENVRVLAIDQIADQRQGGALVARVATLEVSIEDGQRIALASSVGNISLALRNVAGTDGVSDSSGRTIRFSDLQPDEEEGDISESLALRRSTYTMMTVTRELATSSERVVRDQTPETALEQDTPERVNGAP